LISGEYGVLVFGVVVLWCLVLWDVWCLVLVLTPGFLTPPKRGLEAAWGLGVGVRVGPGSSFSCVWRSVFWCFGVLIFGVLVFVVWCLVLVFVVWCWCWSSVCKV
jgi:hypothetical protein